MVAFDYLVLASAYAGIGLFIFRMSDWQRFIRKTKRSITLPDTAHGVTCKSLPKVSIIIPCRNEAHNLPVLLSSLSELNYPNKEIIVVDDQSEDITASVASAFAVKVVRGTERPEGWRGKQWACQQGAMQARGDWLLFTDADTFHFPTSLFEAVRFSVDRQLDLLSCLPFHRCTSFWEKLVGPFHFLVLTSTAPFAKPRSKKVFAIGQYLLFRRDFYEKLGGHAAVKDELVEDLPLVNRCLAINGVYEVFTRRPLFSVRMYDTFADFVAGWRRNFRAGMAGSAPSALFEMLIVVAGLAAGGHISSGWIWLLPCLIGISFLLLRQRFIGEFSWLGPLLLPFSLGLFCFISALAAWDETSRRPQVWKGRHYGAKT